MLNSTPPFLVKVIFFLTKPVLLNTRPLFQPSSFIKLLFFSIEPKYNSSLCLPLFVEGFSFNLFFSINTSSFDTNSTFLINFWLHYINSSFLIKLFPLRAETNAESIGFCPLFFVFLLTTRSKLEESPEKKQKSNPVSRILVKSILFFAGRGFLVYLKFFHVPKTQMSKNSRKTNKKHKNSNPAERLKDKLVWFCPLPNHFHLFWKQFR